MVVLALVLAIILSLLSPYFLTKNNLFNVLDQSVVIGIVAVGMTFVIQPGGIDLSIGSVAGLTGVILGLAVQHFPFFRGDGAGVGLMSGFLTVYLGLTSFVVTSGMMAIGRRLADIFSGQTAISR